MKILIVEDDALLSELLREYLQKLNHETVNICSTGRAALISVGREMYDCAFIDVMLPDMNGLQLLEQIRNENLLLPVVMMSGYPTMDFTLEAMRNGASDFLAKPFGLADMALTLERVTKERTLLMENLSLRLESEAREQLVVVNKALEEKIEDQTKLFEISETIDQTSASENLYGRIVQLASRLTAAAKVCFFILPPDQDELVLISEHGTGDAHFMQTVFEVENGRMRRMINSGVSPIMIRPDQLLKNQQLPQAIGNKSLFSCWPLHIRGKLFGLLATAHNGHSKYFSERETRLIDFLMKKASLAIENMALYESMTANFYGILRSLVNALEAKDRYTGKHSERVTHYAYRIASNMRCSEDQIESLQTVGYLHDIGKIGVADSILNKSGSLTREEFELVKKHPTIGESIVSELGLSPDERAIIRHHHERWDGNGYPDGLSGQEIPFLARIIMVADAFDAMTSKRAYRDAMSIPNAVEELRINRNKQFDADVVDAFLDALEKPN